MNIFKKSSNKLGKYFFEEEVFKQSKSFKFKPIELKNVRKFQQDRLNSKEEWTMGVIMALAYFVLFYKQEFLYFPFLIPKEPKEI